MLKNLFTSKQRDTNQQQYTSLQMLNNYMGMFSNFTGNAYENELVRASVHAIATHVAKTKAKHVGQKNSRLEYLLNVRPNQYMSAYDMFYKFVTQLYLTNNAYMLIQRDNLGNIIGFYPINATNVDLKQHMGNVYVEFTFLTGNKVVCAYEDVIHLRRHFNENDMYGSSNVILSSINLLNTTNQGIENAIKISTYLKGILEITAGSLKPEDIKKMKDEFVHDYMNINNVGGVAAHDTKMKYHPLTVDPKMVDAEQMKIIEDKIFMYYNINKKIVMNEFEENMFNAFYEGVVEPILLALSEEITAKIFTSRERGWGNEIIFTANRLNYASNDTKIKMCKELLATGVLSINNARELFNLEPLKEDKRLISLNYVDAEKQNQYQLGQSQ